MIRVKTWEEGGDLGEEGAMVKYGLCPLLYKTMNANYWGDVGERVPSWPSYPKESTSKRNREPFGMLIATQYIPCACTKQPLVFCGKSLIIYSFGQTFSAWFFHRSRSWRGTMTLYRDPNSVTASTWSSWSSRKTAGLFKRTEGKMSRSGWTSVESETSSTMRPPWISRRRTVPVASASITDAKIACSAGMLLWSRGCGSGNCWRVVRITVDKGVSAVESDDTWVEMRKFSIVEKGEGGRVGRADVKGVTSLVE